MAMKKVRADAGEDVGKGNAAGGGVYRIAAMEISLGRGPQKVSDPPHVSTTSIPGISPEDSVLLQRYLHTGVHCSSSHNGQEMETAIHQWVNGE